MSKTYDDLQAAFAGESMANRKYLAYAEKAEKDGFPQAARLFRAAAAAETVHAHNHYKAMGKVKSTLENLQDAIEGEHYEVASMYPEFLADALEENENKKAIRSFEYALEVEKTHENLYTQMRAALEAGKDVEEVEYWVCKTCGHTHVGEAPDDCPVCGAKKNLFFKVD
jgi:rubrerythrin